MNCKSYIPGYYTMRGLNDTGNCWPFFYENNLLNGHLHNDCMFSSLNGYSEYKEMLKRTMLEHEATFRKQVYELHRLYRIQKDLMEEFQKNGFYRISSWTKTSLSSSEAQSQVTNTNVSPISTLQSCFSTLENGPMGRDGKANTSFRASTNRLFDLQAPADVYIEAEGTERSERDEITGLSLLTATPYYRNRNGDPENELKLTLANVSSANGGAHKYESQRKKSLFHCLADLNEPIDDTSLVGTAYSFPSQHLGVETQLDDHHRPNGSLRSTNLWLQISSSKNPDFDESGSLPEIKKEPSQVCSHFLGETGKSKFDLNIDSGIEKYSMSFEPRQMIPIKANDILVEDLNKAETLFGQKKANFLEISTEGSGCAVSASLFPTWMKPSGGEKQSSAPLQTTSSFQKPTTINNVMKIDTATEDPSGLRSSHLENGKFSHQNGFDYGFHQDSHLDSQLSISYGNLDLNLKESYSFDIRNAVTAAKNKVTSETDGDCEELSPELPWLKKKPICNEFLNLGRLSSGLDLCLSSSSLGNEGEIEIKTPIPSANMQCIEEKTLRNELPSCSSREKIIGFPNFDKIQSNFNFLNEKHHQVDELEHDSVFRDINPLNTEKELSTEKSKSFRNHIDLNCELTFVDESPLGVPLLTSDTSSSSKAFSLIDIEMSSQQNGFSNDILIKEAAENMMKLSIDKFKHLNDHQSFLSTEPPCNTLHLFADLALLNAQMINSDSEMDLFELMTLQLEEMKPEEACCTPQETENAKDDEKSMSLLLFKKPRRGQARKRIQRRDFQKDTLPGLATLSRKEMVEDLQLIGGLLKASGCNWEVSTGRRNSSRNATPAKAKRRQLPRKTSIAITKDHSRPQQTFFLFSKNANSLEFEVDRPGMLGWGRTTRRCRRQRSHPPQSVTTALT